MEVKQVDETWEWADMQFKVADDEQVTERTEATRAYASFTFRCDPDYFEYMDKVIAARAVTFAFKRALCTELDITPNEFRGVNDGSKTS